LHEAHLTLHDGPPVLIRQLVAEDAALYPNFLIDANLADIIRRSSGGNLGIRAGLEQRARKGAEDSRSPRRNIEKRAAEGVGGRRRPLCLKFDEGAREWAVFRAAGLKPLQQRKNDTHASTSDPDSRLYRKAEGREAKLCYMGHATMENQHELAVAGTVTFATGTAERRRFGAEAVGARIGQPSVTADGGGHANPLGRDRRCSFTAAK
jgi:hypothetical protein